ncbi:MAG: 5'-3' exonuclease H3TH domain-containing protein [Myxococcales bacterium]
MVIVSADKDLLQLVGDGVWMLDTMKQRAFGPEETVEKLGVKPEQVRDYLALVGDSSDNVPGVPSVGPKTAVELLTQFDTLEGVYTRLEELKKKALKAKLEEHRDKAYLSRELVTLKDDYELPLDEQALRYGGWDDGVLRKFVKHYGFTRLIDQLGAGPASAGGPKAASAPAQLSLGESPAAPAAAAASDTSSAPASDVPVVEARPELAPAPVVLRVVQEASELPEIARAIEAAGACSLFAAAEHDEPVAGALIGLALSWNQEGVYIPLGHAYLGCPPQIPISALKASLGPVLENAAIKKRTSSAKRDTIALTHHGIALAGVEFDLMLASYLLDADLRGHGMHEISDPQVRLRRAELRAASGQGEGAAPAR